MLKSLFKLFATLKEKKRVLLKQRFYKQVKTKTSQSLPSEENLMLQAVKCVRY